MGSSVSVDVNTLNASAVVSTNEIWMEMEQEMETVRSTVANLLATSDLSDDLKSTWTTSKGALHLVMMD